MNTKLIVSILVLVAGPLIASSVQASVTWDLVGFSNEEPDIVGVMITPDMPVNCPAGPPADCPISGWLTIPEGSLGGPGTTINLAVDPTSFAVIFNDPPNDGDNFDLSEVVKDGYTCGSIVPAIFRCSFAGGAVDYSLSITEGLPRVVIGDGNVWVSGQLQVGGQTTGSGADSICSVAKCSAEGVTILTCGDTQVQIPCVPIYAIGDPGPGGGIVFHVTEGGLHGLEAAPEDQSTGVQWGCHGTGINGADGTTVGSGAQNTADILGGCLTRPIAASVAAAYVWPSGQTDGFLPSKNGLNLMYQNKTTIGGFANYYYWSSTDAGSMHAWVQSFLGGVQFKNPKYISTERVRAVRAF